MGSIMILIGWCIALFFAVFIPAALILPMVPWLGGNRRSSLKSDRTGFNVKDF